MVPELSSQVVCLYNKFGHCKYSETCRKFHSKEICEKDDCEIKECVNRHPKSCKYFDEYRRCKFGEFCSFSHKKQKTLKSDSFTADLLMRLAALEKKNDENESKIKVLNDDLNSIQEYNKNMEIQLTNALEKATKIAVREGTDTLIKIFTDKQDDLERRSNASLDALHQQISMISNLLHPPHHQPESQRSSSSEVANFSNQAQATQTNLTKPPCQKHQCEVCGKTFGSDRALTKHLKDNHEPT